MPGTALIAGGGIAGPALAFFLARLAWHVTVVEKFPRPRTTGQQVDLRSAGFRILRDKMGLEPACRARAVNELGMRIVNGNGATVAEFATIPGNDGASFTAELEILRADLAQVLHDALQPGGDRDRVGAGAVQFRFGDRISALRETSDGRKTEATFASGRPAEEYDLVVAADGMHSGTRALMFPDLGRNEAEGRPPIMRPLGQHSAFFTIPIEKADTGWASGYSAAGGRFVLVRPDTERGRAGGYLSAAGPENTRRFSGYLRMSPDAQMTIWEDIFRDAGGPAGRVIAAMRSADDYYMQEIAQVRMDSWIRGRCAVLGDAAYCPSPLSGLGSTSAIVGAYVMAGELSRLGDGAAERVPEALAGYDRVMRPIMDRVQKLSPNSPTIMNPQTKGGLMLQRAVLSGIWRLGLADWVQRKASGPSIEVPDYGI